MVYISSYVERVKASQQGNVFLITGLDQGRTAWYYVDVEKGKAPYLEKSLRDKGDVLLNEYGTVIISGWGDVPPKIISDKIKAEGASFKLNAEEALPQVMFVRSNDEAGRGFYSFISVPTYLVPEFEEKCRIGDFDFTDYGYILFQDWGLPTEEVLEMFEYNYNFSRSAIAHMLEPA